MKRAKKLFAGLLALTTMFCMSTAVFADTTTYTDQSTVTITKEYNLTNAGTTSPAETFNFTIEGTSVSDAAEGITAENMLIPTIGNVSYASGEAGSSTKAKNITVTLPTYTSVGIYTYTIKETAGDTAGVTYYGNDIILKVTVIEQNGKIRVAAVHTEEGANGTKEDGTKTDTFPNVYSAGSLSVQKIVTGNLGDQSKDFTVTVTFTAPAGKTVKENISYTVDGQTNTIAPSAWVNGAATAEIQLKHGETVTFTNIPYGVTYTVEESDYTGEGYDAPSYDYGDANKEINTASEAVEITNNKTGTVDTGINMDSLPYIMIFAGVIAVAAVALIMRKRRIED